jgi:hypothetical protein
VTKRLITRERAWWAESTIMGMCGAMVAERLIRAAYRAIRKRSPDPVFDPDSGRFSLLDFLVWAVAGGIGLGIAKVTSNEIAAVGWKLATRTPPPRVGEEDDHPHG